MYIVPIDKLPPNPHGALTLPTNYLGKHDNGWEIIGKIHEDYFEWVNSFVAYNHNDWCGAFVCGDFEDKIIASDESTYREFLELFPPEAWNYGDI